MEQYKQDFITLMVRAGVLRFGDFTTKSGRKTPYFVNTGNYRTGEHIARLGEYYAECIASRVNEPFDFIYGPVYKGIPLAVTTAVSLFHKYNRNTPYTFNRKEAKDHGEGGTIIGYTPQNGDRALIIEDVITAGTSVRESLELFKSITDITVTSLVVSVDRRERGTGTKTTLEELGEIHDIKTYAIVTVNEIIDCLSNHEVDGKVLIDAEMKTRMEEYLRTYGA